MEKQGATARTGGRDYGAIAFRAPFSTAGEAPDTIEEARKTEKDPAGEFHCHAAAGYDFGNGCMAAVFANRKIWRIDGIGVFEPGAE